MSAKIDLKFLSHLNDDDFIKVDIDSLLDKRDSIISIHGITDGFDFFIALDKSTAIKFAKTLRTEINKIQD